MTTPSLENDHQTLAAESLFQAMPTMLRPVKKEKNTERLRELSEAQGVSGAIAVLRKNGVRPSAIEALKGEDYDENDNLGERLAQFTKFVSELPEEHRVQLTDTVLNTNWGLDCSLLLDILNNFTDLSITARNINDVFPSVTVFNDAFADTDTVVLASSSDEITSEDR